MFLKRNWQLCVFVLGIANCCHFAAAQVSNPKPSSEVGGYANTALRSIYRSSVGSNYSASSLNNASLHSARAQVGNYGQATERSNRLDLGLGGSDFNKPFASYSPAPTVSPYLNLFRDDLDGNSDFNYQTLVRPQLQQQQFNQQLQRQGLDLARRLQSISAQADFNPQGSQTQAPTGHQTVFMYYGHYYPSAGRRRR